MIMKSDSTKQLILRLTGLSDHEYEVMLFEHAFAYLDYVLPEDEEAQKLLADNKHFWTWWTCQWERRNQVVLSRFNFTDPLMVPSVLVRRRAQASYEFTHQVSEINILINRHVMRSTFQMVRKLTDTNLQTTISNHGNKTESTRT